MHGVDLRNSIAIERLTADSKPVETDLIKLSYKKFQLHNRFSRKHKLKSKNLHYKIDYKCM